MTVMRATGRGMKTKLDYRRQRSTDGYIAAVTAGEFTTPLARIRAEIDDHHSHRPCPQCSTRMEDGRCPEHGMPAEDRGDWLWPS